MAVVLPTADVLVRNNVRVAGRPDGRALVLVHGFGCDQRMWRGVLPHFAGEHRLVLLDQVGAGGSDLTAWSPTRHGRLDGYAEDLVEVAEALDLRDAVVVGHSVGATVGLLAHLRAPERLSALVLVGPSPRYIDDEDYVGGLSPEDADELLAMVEVNFAGWSSAMAPVIMGNPDRPELGQELTDAFCATDPDIAAQWARVTFLSDVRDVLGRVAAPTLVLQCSEDPIVPDEVGRFMADRIPHATFVQLAATGHCPHVSAPDETAEEIRAFLRSLPS